ncbi:MAG TPA: hypothetical protein VMR31_19445 [Myxococcota bacterium]|nr:hypothetical protein [Myxococcota bacterium]
MRWLLRLVVGLLVLAVLFVGMIFAVSEFGGEVVHLHTVDPSGADHVTHVWVVDDAGFAWLRSGHSDTGWLTRIEAHPDVVVERAGQTLRMHAEPVRDPATRDRIHALMREKYPVADRIISAMRDPNGSVPVKLVPR